MPRKPRQDDDGKWQSDRSGGVVWVGRPANDEQPDDDGANRAPSVRSRVVRVIALALFLSAAIATYLVDRSAAWNQYVGLRDVVAGEGSVSVKLKPETRAASPGCGCFDPRAGDHVWYGMGVPSQGFDISVPRPDPADLWALSASAPAVEAVDWFGQGEHHLMVTVRQRKGEDWVTVKRARAFQLNVLLRGSASVLHGTEFPYMALVPAADGTTTFKTTTTPHSASGGSLDVSLASPARGDATENEDPATTDMALRGPVVDVLGPGASLAFEAGQVADISLGAERVTGIDASELEISVEMPFALRLRAFPVEGDAGLITGADETGGDARASTILTTEALPEFAVDLTGVLVPGKPAWSDLATRSEEKPDVEAALEHAPAWDDYAITQFRLPPVNAAPEIGVFGKVTELTSDALSGEIITKSKSLDFVRGRELSLTSETGVQAGRFSFVPLVSTGGSTAGANLEGDAIVHVDGRLFTRVPYLGIAWPFLLATAAALVCEGFLRWALSRKSAAPAVHREHPDHIRPRQPR